MKTRRKVTKIVVHCAYTPEGKEFDIYDIERWHKERNFRTVGYHYVILLDGTIQRGRELDETGAHVRGHNEETIGICYIGGYANDANKTPKDTRTSAQCESITTLLKYLKLVYKDAEIVGHRDLANRDCPCYDAKNEYKNLV